MMDERIKRDFGTELAQLELLGYQVAGSQYNEAAFGNWFVDLVGPTSLRVVRDRGQYLLEGPRSSLEQHGLWRAFDDRAEFASRLLAYAAR
jgi:hypothetical protein